ncbi:MAG: HAD superfamily hydrolase (TIGR01509 family) [Gammaproteobacteria bacterium]
MRTASLKKIINWSSVETVLLDMDGTLLDLHFDNYFWQEYLPLRYAQLKQLNLEDCKLEIHNKTNSIRGTLNWYSTDYWSQILEIDVVELKHEVSHKVSLRPYCVDFLDALREAGKDIVLVTNAHQDSLNLKMTLTGISAKFDCLITVHEFSLPKENSECWAEVNQRHPFNPKAAVLIDDNLTALRSARKYGIEQLVAIHKPDSQAPAMAVDEFEALHSFEDIMPIRCRF